MDGNRFNIQATGAWGISAARRFAVSQKGGQGAAVPAPVGQLGEWEVVVKQRVVDEDWQLPRRCLTRYFAVLVELRVVNEMAIFTYHHKQVTAATLYPFRSFVSFRPL